VNSKFERRLAESNAANQLPSPTGVALAILELTRQEDSSAQEIARAIKADPALSGRLLKFANSPYVGFSRAVASIENAVILLGVRVVRQLSLGLSVLSNTKDGPCKTFDYSNFWSRSLATALATRALSARDHLFPPEEAFVCGLLCQVGRLALASSYPDSYAEILATACDEAPKTLIQLEREHFDTDHNELTAALLKDWGLPRVHIDAVFHYEQEDDGELQVDTRTHILSQYLRLATHMSKMFTAGNRISAKLLPKLIAVAEHQKIHRKKLDKLFNEIAEQWREWGPILEVPTQEVPPFIDLAEKAATASVQIPSNHHTQSTGVRILLVDDDPAVTRQFSQQLKKAGHEVVTASNAREGLQLALEANVQMVIIDLTAPELDGKALCGALRNASLNHPVHIIGLTHLGEEQHLLSAFEAGANDYLIKPVSRYAIAARVRVGERLIRLTEQLEREQEENRIHSTELAMLNRRFEKSTMTDSLTDLPNRHCATECLQKEWETSRRLSCLSIEVDHFKRVSDRYGTEIGDAVLRETAIVLRNTVRGSDLVCRYGAKEFVVICPNTSTPEAIKLAERLRRAVENHQISSTATSLTISVGVAINDPPMKNPGALIDIANRALLHAQHSGGNRVSPRTT